MRRFHVQQETLARLAQNVFPFRPYDPTEGLIQLVSTVLLLLLLIPLSACSPRLRMTDLKVTQSNGWVQAVFRLENRGVREVSSLKIVSDCLIDDDSVTAKPENAWIFPGEAVLFQASSTQATFTSVQCTARWDKGRAAWSSWPDMLQVEQEGSALSPCCRICTTQSKACGDSCIERHLECHQPTGCACDG